MLAQVQQILECLSDVAVFCLVVERAVVDHSDSYVRVVAPRASGHLGIASVSWLVPGLHLGGHTRRAGGLRVSGGSDGRPAPTGIVGEAPKVARRPLLPKGRFVQPSLPYAVALRDVSWHLVSFCIHRFT